MGKLNKYLNRFFVVALVCIFLSIIIMIVYAFIGRKIYINVTDKNREAITEMLIQSGFSTDSEELPINNHMVRIGSMQGLGDWYLYIKYDNGEERNTILDDGENRELYKYIRSNGHLGGNLGGIITIILYISIIYIPIYITYKICYFISKKTDKIIQNDDNN